MLYQTHYNHPCVFFPQVPSPSSTLFTSSSSLLPRVGEAENMECVEAALKTSFRKEICFKSLHQQAFLEDLFPVNVVNLQNGVSAEDFSVDELLDFSNQEEFEEDDEEEEVEEKVPQENNEKNIDFAPAKNDFGPLPAGELAVPVPKDVLASLEWLSHFVEDSNSEYAAPFPAGILLSKGERGNRTEPDKKEPVSLETFFKTPVPAKARSKRTRAEMRVWPLGTPPSESSCSTTSSSTSSSSAYQANGCWLACPAEPGKRLKPMKRRNKVNRTVVEESDVSGGGGPQKLVGGRRCSHCGVQKTPQWRTGPLGAKTLCNACGVRFKSGRLLPEYRPACSPTFSSELHSNSHRKVLEMRRKKEILGVQLDKTGLNPNPDPISVGMGFPVFDKILASDD